MSDIVVMKFGGTSVGSGEKIKKVAKIIVDQAKVCKPVIVVSALNKTTDKLVNAINLAQNRKLIELKAELMEYKAEYYAAADALDLPKVDHEKLIHALDRLTEKLEILLISIYELGDFTNRAHDLIVSFGERMNKLLVEYAIIKLGKSAKAIDATALIRTNDNFGNAVPNLNESRICTNKVMAPLLRNKIIPVVTGFIGSTNEGVLTTLGRGGSDYSATILGYCLDAREVQIWTDVDGVMTADPKIVTDAKSIDNLTYTEAAELSYFGAKVLHPLTMVPAAEKNIPIIIKNTFNPDFTGTVISSKGDKSQNGIKALSVLQNVSLITIQGRGMIGVPGIAAKVFSSVSLHEINVLFISQASSEFNISFIVHKRDGEKAIRVLSKAFKSELEEKAIEEISEKEDLAMIAAIGDDMQGYPGVAGKLFSSLGDAKVNIIAIAQGSSERNISFIINGRDIKQAMGQIHATITN